MHIKLFYILLFVLAGVSVSAQNNFVVYHVNGKVNLVAGKTSAAKRGDIISKSNILQVKPGADCMLIEKKGRSLQVNAPGNYTFDALQKMLSNTKTGVSQKFFSYVYSNMFSQKKNEKLSITPVVFRGDELMKSPGDNSLIISDAIIFSWKKPAGRIPVQVAIWNDVDEKIFDTVLKTSTSLQVNIINNNLLQGAVYKWKAEESGARRKEKYFYFLIAEKKDQNEILKDVKLLQSKQLGYELKAQMQQDIFDKWKAYYLKKT